MANSFSRRSFLTHAAKAGAAITLVSAPVSSLLAASSPGDVFGNGKIGFEQTPLPYAYSDLEPVIDALTMEIHFSRHAAGYASNLRDAAIAEGVDMKKPLEQVLSKVSGYSVKLRNNGGGHYNHEFFWRSMAKGGIALEDGSLRKALSKNFGSIEAFQSQFTDVAKSRFGSGWAWLYVDKNKQLKVGSTPNQDNPLMDISDIKGTPLLGLDVWEHAYYLKYQNKRTDYIAGWWKVVNWKVVEDRFLGV